jgi:hypothetical protein
VLELKVLHAERRHDQRRLREPFDELEELREVLVRKRAAHHADRVLVLHHRLHGSPNEVARQALRQEGPELPHLVGLVVASQRQLPGRSLEADRSLHGELS